MDDTSQLSHTQSSTYQRAQSILRRTTQTLKSVYELNNFTGTIGIDCKMIYVKAQEKGIRKNLRCTRESVEDAFTKNTMGKHQDDAESLIEFQPMQIDMNIDNTTAYLKQMIANENIVKTVAQIVMTDIEGNTIFNEYIKQQQTEEIFWTAKHYSGIPTNFNFDEYAYILLIDMQILLRDLFENGVIFVGHGLLDAMFPSINDDYYKKYYNQIRDTSIYYATINEPYYKDINIIRYKLKELVNTYFGIMIQTYDSNIHYPAENANASLALYMLGKDLFDAINMNIIEALRNNIEKPRTKTSYEFIKMSLEQIARELNPYISESCRLLKMSNSQHSMIPLKTIHKQGAERSMIPLETKSMHISTSDTVEEEVDCINVASGKSSVLNKYLKYKHKYLKLKKLS